MKVGFTAAGNTFAELKIRRGIFKGDALSPLLSVISMKPLHHILRKRTSIITGKGVSHNINGLQKAVWKKKEK